MSSKATVALKGWLSALPWVLGLPAVFWILFAPTQMIRWSWDGLLNMYGYGIPYIGLSLLGHAVIFFAFGFPIFLLWWNREGRIWRFPAAVVCGATVGAVIGIPDTFSGGFLDREMLAISSGYGAATGFGCWIARRRGAKGGMKLRSESRRIALIDEE